MPDTQQYNYQANAMTDEPKPMTKVQKLVNSRLPGTVDNATNSQPTRADRGRLGPTGRNLDYRQIRGLGCPPGGPSWLADFS